MRGSNTRTPGPQLWRKRAGRLHGETNTRPCRCNHERAQDTYRKSHPANKIKISLRPAARSLKRPGKMGNICAGTSATPQPPLTTLTSRIIACRLRSLLEWQPWRRQMSNVVKRWARRVPLRNVAIVAVVLPALLAGCAPPPPPPPPPPAYMPPPPPPPPPPYPVVRG